MAEPTIPAAVERLRKLHADSTPGEWTTQKPGVDAATGFAKGIIVAAVGRGQAIYADPPGGSYPENDRRFIAGAHNLLPALLSDHDRMVAVLRELLAADDALMAFVIGASPKLLGEMEWRDQKSERSTRRRKALAAARAALPEEPADG